MIHAIDPEPNGAPRGAGGVKFSYSAYGYFVGHLVQQFGQERFRAFTRSYVADPLTYRDQFERAFGLNFQDGTSQ
jgi:hypothetical protein